MIRLALLCWLLLVGGAPLPAWSMAASDPREAGEALEDGDDSIRQQGIVSGFDGVRSLRRIDFEGNRVTRESTLLRELPFTPGDTVEARQLMAAAQHLLDLGLFRSVSSELQVLPDGSVAVTYTLRERLYILPTPRLDATSDGTFGGGLGLTWSNFLGRNHSLGALAIYRRFDERDRDNETLARAAYNWRRVGNSRFNLQFFGGYRQQEARFSGAPFDERTQDAGFNLSRQLTTDRTGQGWVIGSGLSWRRSVNSGAAAPPDDGTLTAFNTGLSYRDVRSYVYSEEGSFVGIGVSTDLPVWSDYHVFSWRADAVRLLRVGQRAHQNLNLRASTGSLHGGPELRRRESFSLGGAGSLRGYPNEFAEGDYFWLMSAELLRPVYWDWLRALLLIEAGNAGRTNLRPREESVLVSVGAGFRLRVTWFVNFEVEAGVAVPLIGGDGLRPFASGV